MRKHLLYLYFIILILSLTLPLVSNIIQASPDTETLRPNGVGAFSELIKGGDSLFEVYSIDSFNNDKTGWTKYGASPYLDHADYPVNYVSTSGKDEIGNFGFQNSNRTETIDSVTLRIAVRCGQAGDDDKIRVFLWDGSSWNQLADFVVDMTTFTYATWDVTAILDTLTKINTAMIYLEHVAVGAANTIMADHAALDVYFSIPVGANNYEQVDEETPDEDLSWNQEPEALWKTDTYEYDDFSIPEGYAVEYLRIYVRHTCLGSIYKGKLKITLRMDSGNLYYSGTITSQYSSYDTDYYEWLKNPDTNSKWTESAINSSQIGVSAIAGEDPIYGITYPCRITQVYCVANYVLKEKWVDCQYIGVNNTIAGEPTLFSSEWSDVYASEGLSHFLFSTNNTGTWTNETWSNSWRNVVWADATKTLNSTEVTVAFRFYINVTDGTEYVSTICYFPTTISGYNWFAATIIMGLFACFMVIYALTGKT